MKRRTLEMRGLIVCCFTIFVVSSYVNSARILGLFPHPGKSHHMAFQPLLRRLAEKGHHVTVASFFPLDDPPSYYTDINFDGITDLELESVDLQVFEILGVFKIPVLMRTIRLLVEYYLLSDLAVNVCKKVINLPSLNEALNKHYDVVLMENFNSDCMLGLLYVHNKTEPVIALSSSMLMPWSAERIGVTDNPSYVPVMTSAYTTRMSFLERMENVLWKIYFKLWFRYSTQLYEQALIEKHFKRQIPDLADLGRNISLMFVNIYHALNGAMPLAPGLVEVGGMHLDRVTKRIPIQCEE